MRKLQANCLSCPFRVPRFEIEITGSFFHASVSPPRVALGEIAPRRVVLLSDSHAFVSKQNRHAFDRDAGQKKFYCEGVAESVG